MFENLAYSLVILIIDLGIIFWCFILTIIILGISLLLYRSYSGLIEILSVYFYKCQGKNRYYNTIIAIQVCALVILLLVLDLVLYLIIYPSYSITIILALMGFIVIPIEAIAAICCFSCLDSNREIELHNVLKRIKAEDAIRPSVGNIV